MLNCLRCRNRVALKTARVGVFVGILALLFASPTAAFADDVDIRDAMDGKIEGLTVVVNGSGLGYYGDSLRPRFVNTTDQPIRIKVPIGLRFVPDNSDVQTMIAAGGEIIVVPPGNTEALIKAFCGEMHDGAPGVGDVFTAGGLVTGDLMRTMENLNHEGRFDSTGNSAVWSVTDDLDLESDPEAQRLVRTSSSAAGAAAAGALTGAIVAGGAVIQARTTGTGRKPTDPTPPRGDILTSKEATQWLVDDGAKTISHDGKTYVVPPPRLPPNTDGVAYETITVNGVDVIDESKLAVIPHRDEPVEPTETPPPPPPAEAAPDAADTPPAPQSDQPDNVKLTGTEQQHIVDWGVENQRTPDEIQKDLDAQNESRGGSGTVPIDDKPVLLKLPQGDVTVTAAEAAAYQNQVADIDSHAAQMKNTRRELVFWRQQVEDWVDKEDHIGMRFAGGIYELFRQRNRMEKPGEYLRKIGEYSSVDDMLAKKYNKPQYVFDYDDWQAKVQQWEQGPDAALYNEHRGNIRDMARDSIQQMTSSEPRSAGAAGPFNRAAHTLKKYDEHRENLIETVRVVNGKKAALRELERQFSERMKKGP